MTEIIENIESFNKDIVSWGHRTRQTILGKIPKGRHASGAKEEPLARSFRMNTSKTFGEIDRIGFSGVISMRKLDWFNGPLQSRFENLSDLVAEHKADQAILNFKRMKIQ